MTFRTSLKNHHRLLMSICIAALCLSGGVMYKSAIWSRLNAWKLVPQPELITELYFADSRTLPRTYVPEQPQIVTFFIHNLEGKAMRYTYLAEASRQDGSGTVEVARNTVEVPDVGSRAVPLEFKLPDLGPRARVNITLAGMPQAIHFWLTKE